MGQTAYLLIHTVLMRVVVREGFSRDLADIFLENLQQSMERLSGKGENRDGYQCPRVPAL